LLCQFQITIFIENFHISLISLSLSPRLVQNQLLTMTIETVMYICLNYNFMYWFFVFFCCYNCWVLLFLRIWWRCPSSKSCWPLQHFSQHVMSIKTKRKMSVTSFALIAMAIHCVDLARNLITKTTGWSKSVLVNFLARSMHLYFTPISIHFIFLTRAILIYFLNFVFKFEL